MPARAKTESGLFAPEAFDAPEKRTRDPKEAQRQLFKGIGRGKDALEQQLTERWGVIAGVDEVGRGPLAGPVVAAAVILPADHGIRGITDSKALPEKKREALAEKILERAVSVGVGVVSVEE